MQRMHTVTSLESAFNVYYACNLSPKYYVHTHTVHTGIRHSVTNNNIVPFSVVYSSMRICTHSSIYRLLIPSMNIFCLRRRLSHDSSSSSSLFFGAAGIIIRSPTKVFCLRCVPTYVVKVSMAGDNTHTWPSYSNNTLERLSRKYVRASLPCNIQSPLERKGNFVLLGKNQSFDLGI